MIAGYIDFLTTFNVIGLAIGFIIGANLQDIANAIITDLIMPFINPILEKMSGDKGFIYEMPGGIKFNLDKLVEASIKFIALSIVIFALMTYGVNITKPTNWVEVRNFDKLVSALKKVK